MAATSDNYSIVTDGVSYTIASDYVKPTGAGETAHHQIVKVAYGENDTVNYVSGNAPLPVGLCGAWTRYEYLNTNGYYGLATTILGFTGTPISIVGVQNGQAVGITVGTLTVAASALDVRKLYGGAVGASNGATTGIDYVVVQGIPNAYPVGITTSSSIPVTVSSFSNLGIFGVTGATAVYVQASNLSIRGLTAVSDTITVYGGGTASTVSVGLFGFTGATASPIYAESNALNVNIKSAPGITVTASNLSIRSLAYTTDTITVVGQGASDNNSLATVPVYQSAAVGRTGVLTQVGGYTGAGWCGAAISVYMVNSGVSFNVSATFSAQIGITAPSYAAIPIQGTTSSTYGVWVAGDTANGPVIVKGYSGGFLPIQISNLDIPTSTATSSITTAVGQVKTNTDFLIGMKKALYDASVTVGAFDFNDGASIYTLIKNAVNNQLQSIASTVNPSSGTIGVAVEAYTLQPSFMSRTNYVGYTPKNLTEYNLGAGFTCATGIRIKVSRIGSGANASQNEFMCVISEADAAVYGSTAGTASYTMYHGDEMFFEVDNINKIKVFYPAYSAGFAPYNTGTGITFSFYAS